MRYGIVKWFDTAKGYGFILHPEGGQDIFVHYNVIVGQGFRDLAEGQAVRFKIGEGPKGLFATTVMPTETV